LPCKASRHSPLQAVTPTHEQLPLVIHMMPISTEIQCIHRSSQQPSCFPEDSKTNMGPPTATKGLLAPKRPPLCGIAHRHTTQATSATHLYWPPPPTPTSLPTSQTPLAHGSTKPSPSTAMQKPCPPIAAPTPSPRQPSATLNTHTSSPQHGLHPPRPNRQHHRGHTMLLQQLATAAITVTMPRHHRPSCLSARGHHALCAKLPTLIGPPRTAGAPTRRNSVATGAVDASHAAIRTVDTGHLRHMRPLSHHQASRAEIRLQPTGSGLPSQI